MGYRDLADEEIALMREKETWHLSHLETKKLILKPS